MDGNKCVGCTIRDDKIKHLETKIAYLKHDLANSKAEFAAARRIIERLQR